MTRRRHLVAIWAIACLVAVLVAFAVLLVMIDNVPINYTTELPRHAVTAPMIAVIAFWGIVRAAGVPLDPMRTFVLGGLAVYGLLYLIGRVLAGTGLSPVLVLIVNLAAVMALAWLAVQNAGQSRR